MFLRVTSWKLWVLSCDLQFQENKFTSCKFIYTSCIVILRVASLFCQMEIKLWVANCFLQAASCFLWVTNLKKQFFELQVVFYELKIENFIWRILRVESLRLNCFLQVEHLRYQFYKLSSHGWIKFQGNKSS